MAKKFDLESAVVPFYGIDSRLMIDEVLCSESVKTEKGGKRGRKVKEEQDKQPEIKKPEQLIADIVTEVK